MRIKNELQAYILKKKMPNFSIYLSDFFWCLHFSIFLLQNFLRLLMSEAMENINDSRSAMEEKKFHSWLLSIDVVKQCWKDSKMKSTFLIFLALSSLHLVHSEAGNVSKHMKLKYVHGCLRALFKRIPEAEVRVLCQALIIRFLQEIKAEKLVDKKKVNIFLFHFTFTLFNFLARWLHKNNNFWPTKNNYFAHLCRNCGFLYEKCGFLYEKCG